MEILSDTRRGIGRENIRALVDHLMQARDSDEDKEIDAGILGPICSCSS